MKRITRWAVAVLAAFALIAVVAACDNSTTVANGAARTSAGAATAAANTGPLDPVTGQRIKEPAILAGTTNLTPVSGNKVIIDANCTSSGKCTGSGTSADPFVYKNKRVIGCISVEVSYVTIQDVYVNWQPDGAYESICHGPSGSDGGGAAIATGNGNEVPKQHDVKLNRVEVHGPDSSYWNDSKTTIGASGMSLIQNSDIHSGMVAIWTGGTATYGTIISANYIHHVSRVHDNTAPDHLCETNQYGTPQCIDDLHRELVWMAGVGYVMLYSNYIDMELTGVTHLGQTIECTAAVFTAAQSTWGFAPSNHEVVSNNYIDGGDGCSEINDAQFSPPANNTSVWEHNTFHSGGGYGPTIDSPCNDPDVNTSYVWGSSPSSWPTASNAYDNRDENGNPIVNC